MTDLMAEMIPENCDGPAPDHNAKPSSTFETDQTLETVRSELDGDVSDKVQTLDTVTDDLDSDVTGKDDAAEQVVGVSDLIEESGMSNETEASPFQGATLPILQKIIDLSAKMKDLKKDHTVLSDEVKQMTSSIPDPEVLKTLQLLSTEHEFLKKKYLAESSERKRLYNEVIELKGNIRVFCRCRPLNQNEISNGYNSVIEFESSLDNELQVLSSDSSKKQFKFDHVFRPEDDQEAVFAQTKPIVTSVLDGFNVCIFAYGQTGTGKTFTMEGTPENRGVNYRTLEELFRISEDRGGSMRYELSVSMLEVYNEKIRDLLVDNTNQPTKKLEIKQAADGTLDVPGLVEPHVNGFEEMWELLKSGSRARSVGSTSANELSSRSHCLLRVTVKGENLISGQRTRSQLWLVDLAGSERVGRIEVEGERLKESQFINKSLSALGDVISSLASKTSHIPYRNSKLTHMLQSSLGGDCKTLMFVQISPSSSDLGETLCSLNFASRVRGVESGPIRKQADLTELLKYKQLAEKAKHDEKETKKLQDGLSAAQLRLAAREHMCRNLQEKVRDLENQLAEERKTRLKQETRAFTTSASTSSWKQGTQKGVAEKKPPLAPNKSRLPLRKISNFLPQPSAFPPKKNSYSTPAVPPPMDGKENVSTTSRAARNTSRLILPKRMSIAVRPPQTTTTTTQQVRKPKRHSIATLPNLQPEPNSYMATPLNNSTSASRFNNGRPSFVPRKRYSRLFSPMELKTAAETTPIAMRSSSKFMGSPPAQQASSFKSRPPTAIALQRKPVIWSPLKFIKNRRPSLALPSRVEM
ncbi:putative minus-end-directed kinesin ATPase [Rosa chinensis]|uniref:Kinesin-like protein n=1 Tax=Rosa chinensis TaxID=74649 RepID=A0A2P6R6V4_ROSCH|nr:kinesin-like protein KIN-14S isoform X1 [Rosa chinensis]PRQ42174.1 putative minus-end-directed kinesin ATPase [Rosa chinensis]